MAANNIIIQIGQCGNQIGRELNRLAEDHAKSRSVGSHVYMHYDDKLRCICADGERKVIASLLNKHGSSYRVQNVFHGRRGCGANWALGYYGIDNVIDYAFMDNFMDSLRKEIERCDCYMGSIIVHSICGGTGSGLGSRICQAIKDEYPLGYLLTASVAPYRTGESPLQYYNSLLSLSCLQRYSDGIILYENGDVLNSVESIRPKSSDNKAVSLGDINSYIAHSLAGIVLPISDVSYNSNSSGIFPGKEPWEMIQSICPMHTLKFCDVHYISKREAWDRLIRNFVQVYCRPKSNTVMNSISCLAVARGDRDSSFSKYMQTSHLQEKLKAAYHCVEWNPFPIDYWKSDFDPGGDKNSRAFYLCRNNCGVLDYFDHVLTKVSTMYEAKAFLHWYWKYGCSTDDFIEARETLEATVQSYKEALR